MKLEINNLTYKDIFSDLTLEIKEKDFLIILGSSSCGKTTLAKLLSGIIPNENIKIADKEQIGIVLDDLDTNFVYDTVIENLVFPLENLNIPKEEIDKRLNEIVSYLKMEDILENNISTLSGGEKELVAVASVMITNPKLIILDEAFIMLDDIQKQNMFKLLKKINREKKTTIIYLTSDTENCIYGKNVALIGEQKIIKQGSLKEILQDEKTFKKIKQKLPFMADLSTKLKYYNLIDDIILDESKMVDALWK